MAPNKKMSMNKIKELYFFKSVYPYNFDLSAFEMLGSSFLLSDIINRRESLEMVIDKSYCRTYKAEG